MSFWNVNENKRILFHGNQGGCFWLLSEKRLTTYTKMMSRHFKECIAWLKRMLLFCKNNFAFPLKKRIHKSHKSQLRFILSGQSIDTEPISVHLLHFRWHTHYVESTSLTASQNHEFWRWRSSTAHFSLKYTSTSPLSDATSSTAFAPCYWEVLWSSRL